jgi:hypothetical protein
MLRNVVQSSNLKSIGYDEQQKFLEIEFHSGGIYQYSNIPREIYSNLSNAAFKGEFFAYSIKDNFSTKRVG